MDLTGAGADRLDGLVARSLVARVTALLVLWVAPRAATDRGIV